MHFSMYNGYVYVEWVTCDECILFRVFWCFNHLVIKGFHLNHRLINTLFNYPLYGLVLWILGDLVEAVIDLPIRVWPLMTSRPGLPGLPLLWVLPLVLHPALLRRIIFSFLGVPLSPKLSTFEAYILQMEMHSAQILNAYWFRTGVT